MTIRNRLQRTMPVVAGDKSTRLQILAYTVLLLSVALAPWWIGRTGAIFGFSAAVLSGLFVVLAVPVAFRRAGEGDKMRPEKRLFTFSVFYLFALFTALVVDRMMLS